MTSFDGLGGLGGLGAARPIGRGRAVQSRGSGFALPESSAAPADSAAVAGAAPASLLGAMLAVQEAEGDRVRNRAARRHGEAMLAELAALQRGLLGGRAEAALHRLAGLAEGLPEAADPGLAAALQAVALRARVELARRQDAGGKQLQCQLPILHIISC
jgi:Class II flagellar assembly regulator